MKKINAYTYSIPYETLFPGFTKEVNQMLQDVEKTSFTPLFVNRRLNNGLEFVVIEHEIYDGTISDDLYDVYIRDRGNYCYTFGMDPLGHINKTLEEIEKIIEQEPSRLFLNALGEVWEHGIEDYRKEMIESFRLSINCE